MSTTTEPVTKKVALQQFLKLGTDIVACRHEALSEFSQADLHKQLERGMSF